MKKIIISIIITAIICISGTVYAITIMGKDVSYDNTNSGLTSTNVQGAVDELYEKVNNHDFSLYATKYLYGSGGTGQKITVSQALDAGVYIITVDGGRASDANLAMYPLEIVGDYVTYTSESKYAVIKVNTQATVSMNAYKFADSYLYIMKIIKQN